ncbi:Potassium efflux system KefA protein / Small-conductance mechanosensitive channel [Geitlerinema sp. FC II]|nr:Potassium efflux system KefA protein / Small-conductance mechanosensitive channel [Geitlerinema sp. FC II]
MKRWWRQFGIFLVMVAFVATCSIALATPEEETTETAQAIVDGEVLFEVSSSNQFLAPERANFINEQLQKAAVKPGVESVEVVERNDLPTILLDGIYLMTVTERDSETGRTAREQAEIWADKIRQALQKANRERSQAFLRQSILRAIALIVAATVLHWSFGKLTRLPPWRSQDNPTVRAWRSLLVVAGRVLLWLATIYYLIDLLPVTRRWSYETRQLVFDSLTAPILPVDDNTYSLVDLLVLIALLVGLAIAANRLTQILRSRVLQIARLNRGAQDTIATVLKYSLIVVGTVVVFNIWGLDITSIAIFAGALSVGIGFGLQDIAKNLGSGIVLLFERPIQVGDFVQVGEYMGTVERIGSRSTVVRTLDRVSIIVPNSRFLETEVINWSHDNPVSRLRLPVGVAYGSDMSAVKSALLEAAQQNAQVLKVPPPRVLFVEFGDSSLDFELLVWCADPSQQYVLKSDLYFAIEEQLKAAGVEIPFPQRDLHLRSGQLPLSLSPELEQWLARLLEKLAR